MEESLTNRVRDAIHVFIIHGITSVLFALAFFYLPKLRKSMSFFAAEMGTSTKLIGYVGKIPFSDCTTRSIFIIILIVITILPMIRNLTAEISTDTIWLYFIIGQIVYCICSVRTYVLRIPHCKKNYPRTYVILLEEGLALAKHTAPSSEIASVSAVLSFILLCSRVNNDYDVLRLQITGFIFYLFLPSFLLHIKIHRSTLSLLCLCALVSSLICMLHFYSGFLFLISVTLFELLTTCTIQWLKYTQK